MNADSEVDELFAMVRLRYGYTVLSVARVYQLLTDWHESHPPGLAPAE